VEQIQLAIARACVALGGQAELARALGITPAAVHQWCKGVREVPAERCPTIELETRRAATEKGDPSLIVTCEQLRPDVGWSVLREQAAA
jgi:DNA-binding transcriptional regulator YdaS (Cro superfamily)